jgi:hypothetical protein
MNRNMRRVLMLACVAVFPLITYPALAERRAPKRKLEYQICAGIPFTAYQWLNREFDDLAATLGYHDLIGGDFRVELGWNTAPDFYFGLTINAFWTAYRKLVSTGSGDIYNTYQLTTWVAGVGIDYYPFHSGLLLRGSVGYAATGGGFPLFQTGIREELSDLAFPPGMGAEITVAYEIPEFSFVIGLKGSLALLLSLGPEPNGFTVAVTPFIGILCR